MAYLRDGPELGMETMACTLYSGDRSGDRVYLRAHSEGVASARAVSALRDVSGSSTGMLRTPIAQMVAQEHKDRLQREMSSSSSPPPSSSSSSSSSSPASASGSSALIPAGSARRDTSNELWVEKYRPTKFSQLLSDERVNREVLRWIKAWDPICQPAASGGVVATTAAAAGAAPFASPQQHRQKQQQQEGKADGPKKLRPEDHELLLMLSGPPGSGKTTLAHIAARHAGYEPLEINASDDRSVKGLRDKIVGAMESRAIFGDRRPRCIILDEIDGALGGGEASGIAGLLLELCRAPLKRGSAKARAAAAADGSDDDDGGGAGEGAGAGAAKKKQGKGQHALVCPIICICNDAYASALRPLRDVSVAWKFEKCNTDRLLERLKVVCRAEKLAIGAALLRALADTTEQDVRSCLHSLQFLQGLSGQLTTEMMARMAIGKKDSQRGLFDLWDDVMQAQSRRKARGQDKTSFEYFSRAFSECNEHDRAIQGIQHNFLGLRFPDPTLAKMNACLEWIGVSDLWQQRIYSQQHFAMFNYLPSVAVAVRQLVGDRTMGRLHLEFPTQLGQLRSETSKMQNVLQTFVDGRALVAGRNARVAAMQVLGPFLHIVNPVQLASVNTSLLKEKEKQNFNNLVQVLHSSKMTFKAVKSWNGQASYEIEP